MEQPIIEFKDFSFKYSSQKEPTLLHLNLSIRKGEKILIAGPSGCGKSTMANCINGLIPSSIEGEMTGTLEICGKNQKDWDIYELSRHVGTVMQDTDSQFVAITVGEDIAFALENQNRSLPEMKEKVLNMARIVSMEDFLRQSPEDLSGGQKQRVSLAGVMVDDVDILLFDEPLANLDPATGKKAIDLIDRIHKETGKTILIIEHRLADVLYRPVDRVIVMSDGTIVCDSTTEKLLRSSLLPELGIREPLFLSALKAAGCDLDEIPQVSDSSTLEIGEHNRALLQNWAASQPLRPALPPGEPIIEAEDLCYSYDGIKPVLTDVSFTIAKGEMVSLLGNNGAGKSTIASILMGIIAPDKGTIRIKGSPALDDTIAQRARTVGYVMQNPNHMISHTMIYDEVAFALRQRGMNEDDIQPRVMDMLSLCGLKAYNKWPISALSYGQKKRVTIASILISQPEVLILDEPTAGQDYRRYTDLMQFLTHINHELGITILFITHDMHLALEYTHRSLVLSNGHLLCDGPVSEVFSNGPLLEKANLKKTSLFDLASQAGISDISLFISKFIQSEEQSRAIDTSPVSVLPPVPEAPPSKHKVRKAKSGEQKFAFALSYQDVDSPIHRLNGVTKFLVFIGWVILCLTTFDIRILAVSLAASFIVLKLSHVPFKTFRPLFLAITYVVLVNAIFIFLFSPDQGQKYIGTSTVILGQASDKYALTLETLWYLMIVTMKYFTIFPMALAFASCTHPSEFASSLNKIGLSYRISYSVGLALRYIPEVSLTFSHIMHAQQARGVDISKNVPLSQRIRSVCRVIAPLVLSSMDRIDVITEALVLRGFCREDKRTWYMSRPLRASDWTVLSIFALWLALSLTLRFGFKTMFWYPF